VTTDPGKQAAAVPASFARALLARARASGLDVAGMLRAARLPFDPLCAETQLERMTAEQYSRLCRALLRELGDETGGVMPDVPTPPGTLRMIALGIMGSPSLGIAMRRAIEFNACCRVRGTAQVSNVLRVDTAQREATLSYDCQGEPGAQYGVLCNLAMWLRFCSWLIGQHIDITAATCAGSAPEGRAELRHFFRCPVAYDQVTNSVSFSSRHLDAELLRDEGELAEFLRLAPFHIVVEPLASTHSITHRIRAILGDDFRCELPSFEELTGLLNMSARTLRRRLEKEGSSYQRIKDNARRDLAISLLHREGMTVSEVAELVGFSDPSAFHRSFKKWTGQSPGSYREVSS
jgi:AraC-like DNA-binding protein